MCPPEESYSVLCQLFLCEHDLSFLGKSVVLISLEILANSSIIQFLVAQFAIVS